MAGDPPLPSPNRRPEKGDGVGENATALPSCRVPYMLTLAPIRMNERNDRDDPIDEKSTTEIEDPKQDLEKIDNDDPKRPQFRSEIEEPSS